MFLFSNLLLESFATSLTLMFIAVFVQRPEKQLDMNSGLPGYRAFCVEMKKIKATGQDIQIVIVSIVNAPEMISYIKDSFYTYLHTIDEQIRIFARDEHIFYELYCEQPGNFYIILEDIGYNPVQAIPELRERIRKSGENILKTGARPDTRIVTVQFPKEIDTVDELLRFGHNFTRFVDYNKIYTHASSVTGMRSYLIEAHMDEILDRAVQTGSIKIKYQPLWSVKEERFDSAEAVIALSARER